MSSIFVGGLTWSLPQSVATLPSHCPCQSLLVSTPFSLPLPDGLYYQPPTTTTITTYYYHHHLLPPPHLLLLPSPPPPSLPLLPLLVSTSFCRHDGIQGHASPVFAVLLHGAELDLVRTTAHVIDDELVGIILSSPLKVISEIWCPLLWVPLW